MTNRSRLHSEQTDHLARVLFAVDLNPAEKFGSLEEQIFRLGIAFRESSGLFLPLFPRELGPEAARLYSEAGLEAEVLNLGRFRLITLFRLAALIRSKKIEVVHWNFYEPTKNGYLWGLSLLLPRLRHYYTDHTSRPSRISSPGSNLKRRVKRLLLRRYERVLCVSDFVAACLQGPDRWSNLARWNYLIDTARFSPNPTMKTLLRREHGAMGRFVVLVVAHLVPEKGVNVAIKALRRLPGSVVLWIVGNGPKSAALEALSRELGVESRVRFFGIQRDVSTFMQAADCLVCPSLWSEAAGLVNMEGLSSGLPVVASRIGGIPEIIDHEVNGFLFPPNDDQVLAEILRRLHEDPGMVADLGHAGRQKALENYSIALRITEYLEFYRKATDLEPDRLTPV